jgi:hypothetical protein
MTILIRPHADDCEMVELYTIRKTSSPRNQLVLFCTAHVDILDEMGFDWHSDEIGDYKLTLEKNI